MSNHLTMQELEDLEFKLIRSYKIVRSPNEFVTQIRKKGAIRIETTWELPKGIITEQVLTMQNSKKIKFTFHELNVLDLILNKK